MKLLHIDSSALADNSVTRQLTAAIVARWQDEVPGLKVTYRDLDAEPLPHLTGPVLAKVDPAVAEVSEETLRQFLDADVVVIGAPMYNFGIPSTLKSWIDRVAVAGRTFRYTEKGPEGLAGNKQVIIASGRGGIHSGAASDFQEPYLKFVLGFMGITDVEFVRAEGVNYSPQHRVDAMASALASIPVPQRLAA
ncbi:FMN-dependent NADH-azoreductase [Pseudoxanthomonas beigongshangi]